MKQVKYDNGKLNVRVAKKLGNSVSIVLSDLLEEGKKYVVEKEVYSERNEMKIVIQAVDEVKKICQNWKEIECKDCNFLSECELNKE